MRKRRMIITILLIVIGLTAVVWTGFQIEPKNFVINCIEDNLEHASFEAKSNVQSVDRFYDAVFTDKAVELSTSVVWGRARFNINGIRMKGRFVTYYKLGEGFYRYIEITWFGMPLIKGYDLFTDEKAEFCIAGKVETGDQIEQGQNLALWAESLWSPSILASSEEIEWEDTGEGTARLRFAFGKENDYLNIKFNEGTGLVDSMNAMRYKGTTGEKVLWEIESIEWDMFEGMAIPVKSSVRWKDEKSPWAFWNIEGVRYNIVLSEDFSEEIKAFGLD